MKKKIAFAFIFFALIYVGCRKNQDEAAGNSSTGEHDTSNSGKAHIAGKWYIDSVTTQFYDAAGLRSKGTQGYAEHSDFFFLFNPDSSWTESWSQLPQGSVSGGTYRVTSDSTFTLTYLQASPGVTNERCRILHLDENLFVFSKDLPATFNGTDTGHIHYIFKLGK